MMPARATDSRRYASIDRVVKLEQELENMRRALAANNDLVAELRTLVDPMPFSVVQAVRASPTHSPAARCGSWSRDCPTSVATAHW